MVAKGFLHRGHLWGNALICLVTSLLGFFPEWSELIWLDNFKGFKNDLPQNWHWCLFFMIGTFSLSSWAPCSAAKMLSACFLRWTKFDSVAKGFTRSLPFDILLVFYKDNAFFLTPVTRCQLTVSENNSKNHATLLRNLSLFRFKNQNSKTKNNLVTFVTFKCFKFRLKNLS